jgi:hypothetical protein
VSSRATVALRPSAIWVVVVAIVLALSSTAVITALQVRASSSRDAQVALGQVERAPDREDARGPQEGRIDGASELGDKALQG